MVPLFVAIRGDASKPMLEKISSVLVRIADKVMPLLLLLLGIALIADAISYLVTGASLW
jgi:small neutral amino acid transporter SnatA (MarC family)